MHWNSSSGVTTSAYASVLVNELGLSSDAWTETS